LTKINIKLITDIPLRRSKKISKSNPKQKQTKTSNPTVEPFMSVQTTLLTFLIKDQKGVTDVPICDIRDIDWIQRFTFIFFFSFVMVEHICFFVFLVFGFWFLVFGFWFLVFGFWFLVFGFWLLAFKLI
jgi:hypothetical protein